MKYMLIFMALLSTPSAFAEDYCLKIFTGFEYDSFNNKYYMKDVHKLCLSQHPRKVVHTTSFSFTLTDVKTQELAAEADGVVRLNEAVSHGGVMFSTDCGAQQHDWKWSFELHDRLKFQESFIAYGFPGACTYRNLVTIDGREFQFLTPHS